jgi:hypothetical protein
VSSKERKPLNYYLTLDILPGATHNEILHAYNRAKNTYAAGSLASYGLFEGDTSVSIMDEIEDAFAILGNPAKRREYDLKMGFETWVEEDERPVPHVVESKGRPMLTTLRGEGGEEPTSASRKASAASANKISPASSDAKPAPAAAATAKANKEEPARVTRFAGPSGSDFEPNPDFDQRIRECTELDGAFIKAVRIYRRLAVDQVASLCKLSASHIEVVENEDTPNMPQAVYLRGHVYLIAQALGLPDPTTLAQTYVAKLRSDGKLPRGPFI